MTFNRAARVVAWFCGVLVASLCHAERPRPEYLDQRAVDELKAAAEAGETRAMTVLGWRYYNGVGVEVDAAAARRWWSEAAEKGDVRAMTRLGMPRVQGTVPKVGPESVAWLKKAAAAASTSTPTPL